MGIQWENMCISVNDYRTFGLHIGKEQFTQNDNQRD